VLDALRRKIAALVGVGATPVRSNASPVGRQIGRGASEGAGDDIGEKVAIGLGITTGLLAIVGGALWYYFRHRNSAPPTMPTRPADETAPSGRLNSAPSNNGAAAGAPKGRIEGARKRDESSSWP
jgi:hypothetical protein